VAVISEWSETLQCNITEPSVKVTLTTFTTFLADRQCFAGCYLFTVLSSGLVFIHSAIISFNFTLTFLPPTLASDLDL